MKSTSSTPDSAARPRKGKIIGSLRRATIWLALLLIWEAAYRFIGWREFLFPAPSHVLDALLSLLNIHTAFGDPLHSQWPWPRSSMPAGGSVFTSDLVVALLVSFRRLAEGFSASVIAGAALGILMWRFNELDELLGPLFLGLQTLPSVCWVPLAILAFGLQENGVRFVVIVGSCFAVAIAMRDGLKVIPPLYQQAGLMLGARGWRLYRYVLLPASLPALTTSLRQGFSFAWRSLMGAELVYAAKAKGLGFLLETGRLVSVSHVVGIMIIMVVIGMAADRWIFARLQRAIHLRFGLITS